jgi:hypothetical protein
MRKADAAWWREPQPGPAQGPSTVRGSYAALPRPALIGEQWLLRQVLEDLARDPKVRRFKSFRKTVVHMC